MKSIWKKFRAYFEARWFRKQLYNSAKPTFNKELFGRDVLLVLVTMILSLIVGFIAYPLMRSVPSPNRAYESHTDDSEHVGDRATEAVGPQTIRFRNGQGKTSSNIPQQTAHGTLVRVRLQNTVETFETVPIYAQIIDYGLGEAAYGSVLIGDASGDGAVNRIKATFHMLKRGGFLSQPIDIEGQALSIDGTLGVRAEKVEGLASRALIASGKAGLGGLKGTSEKKDLGSLLADALLQGLQTEAGSDLNPIYNNAVSLRLKPGTEFLVQVTGGNGGVR